MSWCSMGGFPGGYAPDMSNDQSTQPISVQRDGAIWTCTLSNPPRQTLTAASVMALHGLVDEMEGSDSPRVLVLTGGGEGVFVAHYEVGELAAGAEANVRQAEKSRVPAAEVVAEEGVELHAFHQLILRLEASPVITIAALNGNAAGGGLELALGCDFRLLADGPYLVGLPETSVGIIPGAGGTQRFARLLGTARALDLILHAKLLAPAEAEALGLVHRLVPEDRFLDEVDAFARDLAGRAPLALSAAKRAIRRGSQLSLEAGLEEEQRCFERTMRSRDAAGAMRAMLEGRAWEWKGE
jgi:enoyl-CoA hydratase